ncbi:hypothetical protein T484DRAFT_2861188 [Baffinella frigidus]|nr:hypothetical protein T484DRAFT_2861188 [Cryptophyta sp. CCMP2293]
MTLLSDASCEAWKGACATKPRKPKTKNIKQKTEPETRNRKPKTRNPKPETRNPKPETRNPKPQTRNSKLETSNPIPETRNPKPNPKAQNPKPKNTGGREAGGPACKTRCRNGQNGRRCREGYGAPGKERGGTPVQSHAKSLRLCEEWEELEALFAS